MQYIRLTHGLADYGQLLPDTTNFFEIVKSNPNKDLYTSLYKYEDRHVKEFEKTHTVKGIVDVKTSHIFFDFDSGADINAAKHDALIVCGRLIEHGVHEDYIRAYFSGNKGFHIDVLIDQQLSRQEFVNIVFSLASDLKTFDTRINNENRIIRAALSRHPKSKLHKIPLTIEDLSSTPIEDIRDWAKDVSDYDTEHIDDKNFIIPMPEQLDVLKGKTFKNISQLPSEDVKDFNSNDIDFTKAPKWMAKERYALQEGFFYGSESVDKGERNTAFMIMAATYKNQGFSADHTLNLLMTMADKQAKRTGENPYTEEQLNREVISVIFSPSWKGGIYGRDDELLALTRRRFDIVDVDGDKPNLVKISDVAQRFKQFAKTFEQNRIMTGIDPIDENVILTTGMMVGLLGAPGVGKTTLSNAFIENLSTNDIPVIYESLDMYDNLLYTRLLQKYTGYDMKKIIEMYKDDQPDEALLNAYAKVIQNYSNVEFNFRSGLSVEDIEKDIVDYKSFSGKNPKLLVVDYLEKVHGPFSDATANSAYVASRLSDIAKKYDLCVLLLLQPQKSAGDPREELLSMRKVKGASVIEQDCRVIMTMWRPGYNPQDASDDVFMSLAIVKNNMGGLNQIDLGWNGKQGTFRELGHDDQIQLKHLRNKLEQIKAHSRDDI